MLFALPIAFAVLIRHYQVPYRPDPVESGLLFGMIFPAMVPLAALLLATGMVQDDVEEQTMTYLLIRPIPRWAIYLAKLLGTIVSSWVRAAIFTLGMLVVIYWGDGRLFGTVLRERAVIIAALLALALSAYSAIFGALSLLVRRALVFGAIYIVAFEGIFGSIDFVDPRGDGDLPHPGAGRALARPQRRRAGRSTPRRRPRRRPARSSC